jgi:uncharacterized UBP type Zn finger protein
MPKKFKNKLKKKSKKLVELDPNKIEFSCFCCKQKVKAKSGSICVDMYKNGRYALRGICCENDCKLSKIISDDDAEKLKEVLSNCGESSNKVAEAGGILALFALLGGAIAYAVKMAKKC